MVGAADGLGEGRVFRFQSPWCGSSQADSRHYPKSTTGGGMSPEQLGSQLPSQPAPTLDHCWVGRWGSRSGDCRHTVQLTIAPPPQWASGSTLPVDGLRQVEPSGHWDFIHIWA